MYVFQKGFMSALIPSWGWYAAARFVVGVGFGANMVINCIYPLEFVGRQWRVLCGTIGFWSPALVVLPGLVSTIGRVELLRLHIKKHFIKIVLSNLLIMKVYLNSSNNCFCLHLQAYCFREWTHLIYMSTIPGILALFSFM